MSQNKNLPKDKKDALEVRVSIDNDDKDVICAKPIDFEVN